MRSKQSNQRSETGKRFSLRERLNRLFNLSLLQQLGGAFLLITLLGIGGSTAGLLSTNSAAQSVQSVQHASEQIQAVERLQSDWFRVVSSVDALLLTRSLTTMQRELEQNLLNFKAQLTSVKKLVDTSAQGTDDQTAQIIQDLESIALELDGVMDEFYGFIQGGRWGSAQTLRYTRLSGLQTRLEENLSQLNQNIQANVTDTVQAAQTTRSQSLRGWAVASFLSLAFSLAISFYSSRTIANPLQELTREVEKVTAGSAAGKLPVITPSQRKDEIGNLWRAFATVTEWLNDAYQSMEKRVTERTEDLERRRSQVQAAAEVARDITGSSGFEAQSGEKTRGAAAMKNLLDKAVELIRQRFGFYHAGVFLIDDRHEYAVLRAATGEAGAAMLAERHHLKVGQVGLVGFVAESGTARIVANVEQDAAHFRNPRLPETRSEAALPLRAGDEIIGVLDVQSQNVAAFDEQDVTILQVIADQLATAIENTRLVNELEVRLQELESFTAGYGRQSWERLAQLGTLTGLEYDGGSVQPLGKTIVPQAGTTAYRRFPLKLRGEVIANLDVWPGPDGFNKEDTYLLETFTSRVSQILESARLFNEAQQRATREQLLNQLTSTIVRSIDPQAVLEAAAQQLERFPTVAKATVYLTTAVVEEPQGEQS